MRAARPLPLTLSADDAVADRAIRVAALLTIGYLVAGTLPMAMYVHATGRWLPMIAHLAALALGVASYRGRHVVAGVLRDWLPLALGPFLYVELHWLIEGVGRAHADPLVKGWERALFPDNPSATWATAMPLPWLSEALHLAYASYYLLVYVPPALLYLRRRRAAFAATMLPLVVVYGICFAAYLVLPVDGPRFLEGPAAAPDGPIRAFVLRLLEAGSSRGTAFPSSHVAASVVATLCALRHQREPGLIVGVLTVGLAIATVYGGFHYAVDALAGVVVALVAWMFAAMVWRALARPGAQRASAA